MFVSAEPSKPPREERLEKKVNDVAESFGMDISDELGGIEVSYLQPNVNAQTFTENGQVKISFNSSNFFEKSESQRERIILHELVHVKQFNHSLHEWASDRFNVSDDFKEELMDSIWEDVRDIEGETEMIVSNLMDGKGSYPHEKVAKENELASKGFDIDSELSQDIEEEMDQLYKEVSNVEVGENIYIEEGEIDGVEYTVAVMGEYAPEKGPAQVESYLEQSFEAYESDLVIEEEYVMDDSEISDISDGKDSSKDSIEDLSYLK